MTLAHSRVRIGTHAVRDRQPGVVRPAAEQPELARRTPVALAHPRVAIATRPPAAAEPRPVDATAAVARDRSALGRLTPNVPIADGKERCGVEARVEPRIHPRIDARVHPPGVSSRIHGHRGVAVVGGRAARDQHHEPSRGSPPQTTAPTV